jgi:hypothetical protein
MAPKYCSTCIQQRAESFFFKNPTLGVDGGFYKTCSKCRGHKSTAETKRKKLQELHPNVGPIKKKSKASTNRKVIAPIPPPVEPPYTVQTRPETRHGPITRPQSIPPALIQPKSRPRSTPACSQPHTGFLPPEEWGYIRKFYAELDNIDMEECSRCRERWFEMRLRDGVCYNCSLRDKMDKTPFLMSMENDMDPGDIPSHLPELSQIEEEIIAHCHIQMSVRKYRGQQYKYTGHCVSFMQDTVKTVSVLPNLPVDLDVVIIRPTDEQLQKNLRY